MEGEGDLIAENRKALRQNFKSFVAKQTGEEKWEDVSLQQFAQLSERDVPKDKKQI